MANSPESVINSYLEGDTSKEEAAAQIASFMRGDITAASLDQQKVQKMDELFEEVQAQAVTPITRTIIRVSIRFCTGVFGCR